MIAKLWYAAIQSPEFRRTFADHAFKDTQGALSDAKAIARLDALNNYIKDAVIGESARWGDELTSLGLPLRTRDGDWTPATQVIRGFLTGNANRLLNALKAEGYYPSTAPSTFSIPPGTVLGGALLTLNNPNSSGAIYFTTDGSDPVKTDGTLSPTAVLFDPAHPISLDTATTVRTRVLKETEWSALNEANYAVKSGIGNLRLTEMMYHPKAPAGSAVDPENFEFVELKNTGTTTLDLTGVQFTVGITYTFGNVQLTAGAYIVVAKDLSAFQTLYGTGINVVGPYSGKLDNSGERVTLTAPGNIVLADFQYSDAWYPSTDGDGYSMVVVDPLADPSGLAFASGWRASANLAGTPGSAEAATNQPPVVSAGADQTVALGDTVTLAGTATDDGLPAGGTLASLWTVVSGPGDVAFGDATLPATTATFSAVGAYVLRLTAGDGVFNTSRDVTISIDAVVPPPPPPDQSVYEGESAAFGGGTVAASNHTGFTGTGFADFAGNGSSITWSVTRSVADTVSLTFRYANGTTSNRPLSIIVNGVTIGSLPFAPTGSWDTWATTTIVATLTAGTNTIKTLAGPATGSNIDNLTVTPGAVPPPPPPPNTGMLSGFSFDDANANGAFDGTDTQSAGKTVFLDANNNGVLDGGEKSTLTANDGSWTFGSLAAGAYHVREVLASGTAISTSSIDATLAAAQVVSGLTIGINTSIAPPPPPPGSATISGTAFTDHNAKGKYDTGDGVGKSVNIFLDLDNDGVMDANEIRVLTDINGRFSFTGLPAGTYHVRRAVAAGFSASPVSPDVTLAAGKSNTGLLLGVFNILKP